MGRTRFACAAVLALSVGCGNEPQSPCAPPKRAELEHDTQRPADFTWDVHSAEREAPSCTFKAGDPPDATLGHVPPFADKVKHVIVLLRENRSFDHYLGAYRPQHDALRDDITNPDPNPDPVTGMRGVPVPRFHSKQYCPPPVNHEWNASHLQFNNGALDGFVAASNTDGANGGGRVAMGYFDRSDIPVYYWLADNFALSESYHASALAPTMANVSFYFNATACGTTENFETTANTILNRNPWESDCAKNHSIFEALDAAKPAVSYQVYNDAWSLLGQPVPDSGAAGLTNYNPFSLKVIQEFKNDVQAEEMDPGGHHLAEVIFIEPNYGHVAGLQNDEHPRADRSSNVQDGQHFTWDIVNTLLTHPTVFSSTVLFVTWDENGGFYDHVVPPPACEPDGNQPCDFLFNRYGFRVPLFAVSPFAIPHFPSHYTADHTSILRFIETWKGLPALTRRDANAWPLLDMFDFEHPTDPSLLPPFPEPAILPCPAAGEL